MEENINLNDKKRKVSKGNFKVKRLLIILFGIIVVGILSVSIGMEYIIFDKNESINLVINNKNVTGNLKQDILIKDDIIYLSVADISNFFDNNIYLEKDIDKVVTTYRKKIVEIGFDSNTMEVNGSNVKIDGCAILDNEEIFLPISEMNNVYEIESKYTEDTKVVTLDSTFKAQDKATVVKSSSIKSTTKFISKTIDRIGKGEEVVVISTGENYAMVRTKNGKIGYIKKSKLGEIENVRLDMEEEKQIEENINMVWDYYSEVADAPIRKEKIKGVNVISPAFFHLDNKGEIIENGSEEYVELAKENGYKVWPMISNAGTGMIDVTSDILNDYSKRKELIKNIFSACIKSNVDGINVDFENMYEKDKDVFSRFIIELTPIMKEAGLVVSVDVTAPDGGETWSMCYDRNRLGKVADYIVFMAYDEYGEFSEKAGTTSGYDWIELSLNKFLKTEEIPSNKIILGLPFYTRLWTVSEDGKVIKTSTVSIKYVDKVISENVEKKWLEEEKQYYVEYIEEGNTKKMWIEDKKSLEEKLNLVKTNKLAGAAFWAKDMEYSSIWNMINEKL